MGNYSQLLADINAAIYQNNEQEIDALEVRAVLREMVSELGSGYLFKGVATPSSPGTTQAPDENVFYVATTAGTYTYLGGLSVSAGEVAFLCYDGSWTKKSSDILSTGRIADNLTTNDATKVLSAKQGKVLKDAQDTQGAELTELEQKTSQLDGLLNMADLVCKSTITFVQGTIANAGGNAGASNIIRSYVAFTPGMELGVPDGFKIARVYYYSAWATNNSFTFGTYVEVNARSYKTDNSTYNYARIIIVKDGGANFTPSDFLTALFSSSILRLPQDFNSRTLKRLNTYFRFNFYDPTDPDFMAGAYLSSAGYNSSAIYAVTGFIPFYQWMGKIIGSRDGIALAGGGSIGLYDANKQLISLIAMSGAGGIATWQTGVAYVRYSVANYSSGSIQIEIGDTISAAIPNGTMKFKMGSIPSEALAPIGLNSVNERMVSFFRYNLYNPNDPDIEPGYYLSNSSGAKTASAYYLITGYIPFSKDMVKLIGSVNGASLANAGGFLCYYDANKNCIGGQAENQNGGVATWYEGVAYVRFSMNNYTDGNIQVEIGNTITPFIEYGKYDWRIDVESKETRFVASIMGEPTTQEAEATLTDGNSIELTDFPYYIKGGQSVSFEAGITSFSGLRIGKGYLTYRGRWLEIDGTNIVLKYQADGGTETIDSVAHGLTFDTFIKIALTIKNDGQMFVLVQTKAGYYSLTFTQSNYESNGQPFVTSVGSTFTNPKLDAANSNFRKSVWAFGDSYFGFTGKWPGILKGWGYLGCMVDGVGGINAGDALTELRRALAFGTPKYILWCLGMNGSDSNFTTAFDALQGICETLGITLIAATIPTTPLRDKETISQYVRDSGERYIDFYKAVGADSAGNWYTGYLSSDDIHPTELGSQALATQVLVDFPEMMQYRED